MASLTGYLLPNTPLIETNLVATLYQYGFNLIAFGYSTMLQLALYNNTESDVVVTAVNPINNQTLGTYIALPGKTQNALTISQWNGLPYVEFQVPTAGVITAQIEIYQDVVNASTLPLSRRGVYEGQVLQYDSTPDGQVPINP